MDSNVAQKFKKENHYSNTNNIFTTFKVTTMSRTEVQKCNVTTNCFHH